MGIKNLYSFIQRQGKKKDYTNYVKEIALKDLHGKVMAVDASIFVYRFVMCCGGRHVESMKKLVSKLIKLKIKPVFVFDGPPPDEKQDVLDERRKRTHQVTVTQQDFQDIRDMLLDMDILCIDAPGEAEAQCAFLNKQGLVDCVASEDMDTLCFGAPCLITGLNASGKPIRKFSLNKVLKTLDMPDMTTFVDFCILCGCDYVKSLHGIGPVTAHSLLTDQHKRLEDIISDKGKDPCPFLTARRLFLSPTVHNLSTP